MKRLICLAIVWCLSAGGAHPQSSRQERREAERFAGAQEVVYKTVGDIRLRGWVFRPQEPAPEPGHPAVVFFFGGGWRTGSPAQFVGQCRHLQRRGVAGIVCDYRVARRHQARIVDCVEDAKSAIRWFRQHAAELKIDPHRICAAGGSAGGHIACCTGLVSGLDAAGEDLSISSVPNAMVLFNPAVLLAPLDGLVVSERWKRSLEEIGRRTGTDPRRISPMHQIRPGLPPTLILHGRKDRVVPYEFVEEFVRRSRAAGNDIRLVGYEGAAHGFFNRRRSGRDGTQPSQSWYDRTLEELDRFLGDLGWMAGATAEQSDPVHDDRHLKIRRGLDASRRAFETTGRGRVAFLGGSITEMDGYRPLVETWLTEHFPQTQFEFVNAGIASTCSHAGAFRLERDVFRDGPVDLLFVDFAVNDDQDAGHGSDDCVRGVEGIVRHALLTDPETDIVLLHFPNDSMLRTFRAGRQPKVIREHERVAEHYGIPSVSVAGFAADAIDRGELTWEQYGGTHPHRPGQQLAARLTGRLLTAGMRIGRPLRRRESAELPSPIRADSFWSGRLIPAAAADVTTQGNWQRGAPDWDMLPGRCRDRFRRRPLLSTVSPGALLSLDFIGTAVGAWVLAGPDAAVLEFRMDDGPWESRDLLHRWSRDLHYPRVVLFGVGLSSGRHRLEIRVAAPPRPERGSAVRILDFAVNGPK